ncbi:response regulator [Roseivivax marinus]|uniref:response regulator n=1 Tax=Roseivivax marinus TaxID=1379903 RepID=UPI00273CFD0E|nr:response regulator [Roseivivax marinus]
MRILIVEDNALIALDLEMQLTEMGCEVIGISVTAEAAIAKSRQEGPDLAIVDLQLADGSRGQDVAMALRTEMDIPSVIVSGSLHQVTDDEKATIRPIAMLSKPSLPGELQNAVVRCEAG